MLAIPSLDTDRRPLHLRLASLGAGIIAFLGAFEPNLALRYGPVIAVAVFVLSNPLRFKIGRAEWVLVAFLLWCTLAQTWATTPLRFALSYTILASAIVMFIGIRSSIRWGGTAFVIIAYAAGSIVGLARTSLQVVSSQVMYVDQSGRIAQVDDLNVNYVAYSSVGAVLLLVMLLRAKRFTSRRLRIATYATLVVLCVGVITTQTRGAQIALLLLAVWLILSRFGNPIKTITVASMAVSVAVCASWLDGVLSTVQFGDRATVGLSGRLGLWDTARAIWAESPFFGSGLGAVREQTPYNLPSHNMFLELGATLGIVGLAIFITFLYLSQTSRLDRLSIPERRFRLVAILVTFLPIMLSSDWEMTASGWIVMALLSQPIFAKTAREFRVPNLAMSSPVVRASRM